MSPIVSARQLDWSIAAFGSTPPLCGLFQANRCRLIFKRSVEERACAGICRNSGTYSYRSATVGSTCVARLIGISVAMSATRTSSRRYTASEVIREVDPDLHRPQERSAYFPEH